MTTNTGTRDLNRALDGAAGTPQTIALLTEIRDELRDFNRDMERLNTLTEEQVTSTVENRRLTAMTLMFVIPSTFAAIPGANFAHLDEYGFDNFYALPILVGTVLLTALATFGFVRKKGWL
ncbi:hypothetical protein [Streptomyces sp. cg35]|uniref:hypothetical protein n=1 Tax=Streptomyces sp. cg35 TaxID=3421650 RepID=UPI003D18768E